MVLEEYQGSVCTLTFGHGVHNDMPSNVLAELRLKLVDIARRPNIKIVVLRSGGDKTFCAGANFDELLSISNDQEGHDFFNGFAGVINAIRLSPQIFIARVQGKAVGGGLGLAAVADYGLALETAAIKLSELAIGIGPFVIGPAVERKMGIAAFSQLTLSPQKWFDASWAQAHGLYQDLFPTLTALDEAVKEKANQLSEYGTEALKEIKKMLWSGTDHWDDLLSRRAAISGRLINSHESQAVLKKISSNK